ncbi:MAG: hypothetical protein R6T98_10090 [Desulfatiglandales bacterium]
MKIARFFKGLEFIKTLVSESHYIRRKATLIDEKRFPPYHIQINIDEASKKVISTFNCCRMITIFPKRPLSIFFLIELLAYPFRNQLN